MMSQPFVINVLVLQEDEQWCAIALEMDLRGYGVDPDAAVEELKGCVEVQIKEAAERGNLDLAFFEAEAKYWRKYNEARREELKDFIAKGVVERPEHRAYEAVSIPVPQMKDLKNKHARA